MVFFLSNVGWLSLVKIYNEKNFTSYRFSLMNKIIKIGIGILASLIPWSFLYAMESFDTAWEKRLNL